MPGADTLTFTTAELDALALATAGQKNPDGQKMIPLDRIESPLCAALMKSGGNFGNPVNNGVKFFVKGNMNARIYWWSGADPLPFHNQMVGDSVEISVGKGHLGIEMLYHFVESLGIRVDYNSGIKWQAKSKEQVNQVSGLIGEQWDSWQAQWTEDLCKRMLSDNGDALKCFTGLRGILSPTSASTGTFFNKSRTNPLYRHNLYTGLTVDNLRTNLTAAVRACSRYVPGKKRPNLCAMGDTLYDLAVSIFLGTTTTKGLLDQGYAKDGARELAGKWNLALPPEAFMVDGTIVYNDPLFARLHDENPTASPTWAKLGVLLNTDYVGYNQVMADTTIPHGMPYNQRLARWSMHGEGFVWCKHPRAQAVLVAN